jgi:Helix-loop-helix DNA-binding domain
VENHAPPKTDTNTGAATGVHHGPEKSSTSEVHQKSADGPTDPEHKATNVGDDLRKDNMTSITAFQVSPDLMEQTPFHSFGLHEDKFDPTAAFATNSNNFEFPAFPDPPPLPGNPLFDEKETAFMSSFFDTVDQNTSFDHEFQDGLAQWTVPGLDLTKGFDDVWATQQNLTNGTTNNYTTATTVYNVPQYEVPDQHYPVPHFPKTVQNHPVAPTQPQPQQYNPSPQNFLSHLHNPNHNPNDLARSVFTNRNSQGAPSQCDPLFSGYPSLNIPAASPSALPGSAVQTPSSTPKMHNYSFLKHEVSSTESQSPPTTSLPPRVSISRPSTYAPSSSDSSSPRPTKSARKKRRENLSEHQKRINHITSEQKRRNLIQQGFNEIHAIVPTLRGQRERGDSKSTVLLKTVEYIVELREGNDRLRRMLKR